MEDKTTLINKIMYIHQTLSNHDRLDTYLNGKNIHLLQYNELIKINNNMVRWMITI